AHQPDQTSLCAQRTLGTYLTRFSNSRRRSPPQLQLPPRRPLQRSLRPRLPPHLAPLRPLPLPPPPFPLHPLPSDLPRRLLAARRDLVWPWAPSAPKLFQTWRPWDSSGLRSRRRCALRSTTLTAR